MIVFLILTCLVTYPFILRRVIKRAMIRIKKSHIIFQAPDDPDLLGSAIFLLFMTAPTCALFTGQLLGGLMIWAAVGVLISLSNVATTALHRSNNAWL